MEQPFVALTVATVVYCVPRAMPYPWKLHPWKLRCGCRLF